MKIYLLLITTLTTVLSGCTIQEYPLSYKIPAPTGEPVLIYPPEPIVGETIIINGRPYYRYYHGGHYYYHHKR